MKVFLFDGSSGLYTGEDFQTAQEIEGCDDITLIPPPPYKQGEIPLFDRQAGCWRVVLLADVRSGRDPHGRIR